MTPLRVFQGLYGVTFGVTFIVGFVAPEHVRWPFFALGVLVTLFGACLMTDALRFATDLATKAGTSRWTSPAFASVPLVRALGVAFLLGGVGFAAQALLVDDL